MPPRRRARGLALVCALLLMLAALLAGLAVARTTFDAVAAARAERERMVARGAAEAALLDAERDIEGSGPPARAARFTAAAAPSWPGGCGQGGSERGLCGARDPPAWQTLDLAARDNPALIHYGEFTGAPMAVGRGLLPARLPAYLIESLAGGVLRITAVGVGTRASTLVVLQALYRKHDPAPPAGTPGALPQGRIGWREIADWPGYTRHLVRARRVEGQVALIEAMQQQERWQSRHNTYVAFSPTDTDGDAQAFKWWSGHDAASSAYELDAHACPDSLIADCVEIRARPGTGRVDARFRDADCGVLTLDSLGRQGAQAAPGSNVRCWP